MQSAYRQESGFFDKIARKIPEENANRWYNPNV